MPRGEMSHSGAASDRGGIGADSSGEGDSGAVVEGSTWDVSETVAEGKTASGDIAADEGSPFSGGKTRDNRAGASTLD